MDEETRRKIDMPFVFRGGKRYPLVEIVECVEYGEKTTFRLRFRHTQSGKEVEVIWENEDV
jgi:hypothetical protein